MRLSHARRAMSVRFDDPNLVSCAGLTAVMALAARCGLAALLTDRLHIAAKGGANATAKVLALVAGMVAGADSISDMDLLRHGAMGRLFTDIRAPSTLGTFLRLLRFGHVRQLDAVAARFLARLAGSTPILTGADQIAFVDIDDTVRATYGYAKQGTGRGYTGVKGLERAAGHDLHTAVRAGDRRHPPTQRSDELGARRGEPARRRPGHRAALRCHRAADRARRLGLLQPRHHRRRPPCRGPVLRHRPPDRDRDQGHHHHRRAGLGADPLPERDLRRPRAALGLRRRARRDRLHRVHRTPPHRAHHRPG